MWRAVDNRTDSGSMLSQAVCFGVRMREKNWGGAGEAGPTICGGLGCPSDCQFRRML